jgi:hypothetical protein
VFITPIQVMENALNEYKGEEVGNDIANLPKVKAGRFMETGITNLFYDRMNELCGDTKTKCISAVPKTAHKYRLKNGTIGSSLDNKMTIRFGPLDFTDHNNLSVSLNKEGPVEIKNYSGAADAPIYPVYEWQCQTHMLTTGSEWCILVRLVNGWDLQYFVIQRNEDKIRQLIDVATDFWNRFDGILDGKDYWYPAANSKEASRIYKGNGSKNLVDMSSNNEMGMHIEGYIQANDDIKNAEERKDKHSLALKEIMQKDEYVVWNDYKVSHSTMTRKKTKMVPVPDAPPTITRRFSITKNGR